MARDRFDKSLERIFDLEDEIISEKDPLKKKELVVEFKKKATNVAVLEEKRESRKIYNIIFSIFVSATFFMLNVFVITLVYKGFQADLVFIEKDINYNRLINSTVILSLITGILIETALAFGLLAAYVFRPKGHKTLKNSPQKKAN